MKKYFKPKILAFTIQCNESLAVGSQFSVSGGVVDDYIPTVDTWNDVDNEEKGIEF